LEVGANKKLKIIMDRDYTTYTGKVLERYFKEKMIESELYTNIGEHLSIDESMHARDLFTFLSNKDGHGKKGTLVAAVRGTKASEVVAILMKIPEEKRLAVKEVTMDYSDSMYSIVTQVFPNASIVIDCFHVMKNQCDALDCIRMRFKRKAIAEQSKEKKEFNRKKRERKAARARYRKSHPKKRGEKRGRPRKHANEKYVPAELSNGDTKVELFTRVKRVLPQSGEKWSESQKNRANMVFEFAPMFSSNSTQLSACSSWSHSRNPLKCSL
jgi:transposase